MSLEPPPYLSSLQNNIRQRPIPWEGAARVGTVTEAQLAQIRAVDKVRKEQRKQVVEADLDGYRILFVGGNGQSSVLESASKRPEVLQYLLVLLSDLLDGTFQVAPSSERSRSGCTSAILPMEAMRLFTPDMRPICYSHAAPLPLPRLRADCLLYACNGIPQPPC